MDNSNDNSSPINNSPITTFSTNGITANVEDRHKKTPEQLLNEDFSAFIKVRYSKMRRLDDIDALIAVGTLLEMRIAAAKPALFSTRVATLSGSMYSTGDISPVEYISDQITILARRPIIIMQKAMRSRLIELRKHREKIERINASKVNTQRRQREDAMRYRAENQVLPALIQQNISLRGVKAEQDKERASSARTAMSKPVLADLIRTGYPINGTPGQIKEWEQRIEADRIQSGTTEEYSKLIARMNEEAAKPAPINTDPAISSETTSVTDDTSTVGTADEWSKLI